MRLMTLGSMFPLLTALAMSCEGATPSVPSTDATTSTPTPTDQAGALMAGEIESIDGRHLLIRDATGSLPGPVGLAVELTPNTLIRRAVGSAPSIRVLAGNDVPLHASDNIDVGGPLNTDGSVVADEIEVEAFSTRDGIVTSIGPNYFDVRLRKDRMSQEFSEASRRIWMPTPAELQNLRVNCGPSITLEYLKVGEDAAFQGLFADDGSFVAVCLFRLIGDVSGRRR